VILDPDVEAKLDDTTAKEDDALVNTLAVDSKLVTLVETELE
jgi:hypothetical protein